MDTVLNARPIASAGRLARGVRPAVVSALHNGENMLTQVVNSWYYKCEMQKVVVNGLRNLRQFYRVAIVYSNLYNHRIRNRIEWTWPLKKWNWNNSDWLRFFLSWTIGLTGLNQSCLNSPFEHLDSPTCSFHPIYYFMYTTGCIRAQQLRMSRECRWSY